MYLQRGSRRTFLQHVYANGWVKGEKSKKSQAVLSIWRFDVSAWMLCTTGKENLPSVRSSAKPLFDVYWRNFGRMTQFRSEAYSPPCSAGSSDHRGFGKTLQWDWQVERSHWIAQTVSWVQMLKQRKRTRRCSWYRKPSWSWRPFLAIRQFLGMLRKFRFRGRYWTELTVVYHTYVFLLVDHSQKSVHCHG